MSESARILLVDDDPAVREALAEVLRFENYDVSTASTGQAGVEIARNLRPSLVLLDVRLPDANGIDVCREIKQDPALEDVFVALFSGEATSGANKVDGAAAGADDYIIKPVGATDLLARVRILLRLRDTTAALRAKGEHYRQLINDLPDAVTVIDARGRLLAVNPRGVSMLGYPNDEELLGKNAFELVHEPDRIKVRGSLGATIKSGAVHNVECRLPRKDGSLFPVELSASVLRDNEGKPLALLAVVRDITQRRLAEEQIRLLADAVQSAQELISVTDPANRFIFINRAFLDTYGYTEEEVLERTPAFLYARSNPPELCARILEQTLQGGWNGELLNRRKDGSEFPISLSTSLIRSRDGELIGLIGVARDISDLKRAEKQRAAFATLGYRLSAAATAEQAAWVIMDVASDLFGWDAGYVHLYEPRENLFHWILTIDTIDGYRVPVQPPATTEPPSVLMREVLEKGARLLTQSEARRVGTVPFGDVQRLSETMMYVPIHSAGKVIGILSIQSYTPDAYRDEDLQLLQTLANHCGDALQRIQVAEELKNSRQLQRAILDNIPDPAWLKDGQGRYLACNEAQARLYGKRIEEIIGKTTAELAPADAAESERQDSQVLRTRKPAFFENQRPGNQGTARWFETYNSPLLGPAGQIVGIVGIAREVTERKRLEQELRRLPRRIIEAQEAERLRVARELHDSVNQLLASAQMRLGKVQESSAEFRPSTREILARCHDLLVQALEENRRIAQDLRPSDLDELGFTIACRNFCKQFSARTGISVKTNIARFGERLSATIELNLFRIVQEALNNVHKHARAKKIHLGVAVRQKELRLTVRDDGRGFELRTRGKGKGRRRGIGLTNIRERAAALGGTCEVESAHGAGTLLTVTVPFKKK